MKKGILFAIVTGVLSFVLATLFGYKIVDLGYWLVSIPVVVVLNVVYLLCKDDDSSRWVSVDDYLPNDTDKMFWVLGITQHGSYIMVAYLDDALGWNNGDTWYDTNNEVKYWRKMEYPLMPKSLISK